jgi:ABC-type polysaccharide/polyol phosphate export permease
MFVTGVSCFLAPVAVFFKDLSEIIRFAVMTLMIVSPIAWLPEEAPGVLSIFLYANPVSYYIISFQDLIVFQRLPGTGTAITIAVQSVLMYLLGFWFIRRLKQMVSDYA